MTKVSVRLPGGPLEIDDGLLDPARRRLAGVAVRPVRLAYAAAHVVMLPRHALWEGEGPAPAEEIDLESTAAVRCRLAAAGFAIAEAMDTAQRSRLGWPGARSLIETCAALDLPHGFVAGVAADHRQRIDDVGELARAVAEQAEFVRAAGGEVIVLPLPWLVEQGCDEDGYVAAYEAILAAVDGPLYVHWLGEAFAPGLRGYFPGDSFRRVMALDPTKVRGAKLSILDPGRERALRAELVERGQIVLTGDDWHFAELIDGPPPRAWTRVGAREVALGDFSHALLGAFDAVAEPASLALRALAAGGRELYRQLMGPAQEVARVLFEPPVAAYKAGLAFLAWLDGKQDNFLLAAREDRLRDTGHLLRVARAAARAGVFTDAEEVGRRLRRLVGGSS